MAAAAATTSSARVLGSLGRAGCTSVRFVQVTADSLPTALRRHRERELRMFAEEETFSVPDVDVIQSNDIVQTVASEAGPNDLIILGLRHQNGKRLFSELALHVARKTSAATLMISRRT